MCIKECLFTGRVTRTLSLFCLFSGTSKTVSHVCPNLFGKGSHPLLWTGSRADVMKTTSDCLTFNYFEILTL
jgi:hypothetical protein